MLLKFFSKIKLFLTNSYTKIFLLFNSFLLLFIFFISWAYSNLNLNLKLENKQILVYQQSNYYYFPSFQEKKDFNSQERFVFSIKVLNTINQDKQNDIYNCQYTVDTFVSKNFSQDQLNLINSFLLKGFKVLFYLKSNYDLLYSPEIIYFYKDLPNYEANKNIVDYIKNSDYFFNIVKNSINWMKPLESGEIISEYGQGYIKFNAKLNYYFVGPKKLNLSKNLSNVNVLLYQANGKLLNVESNLDLFKDLKLMDSNLKFFEYYEVNTNIPILLQREINMKFDIEDFNLKQKFFQKTGKTYLEFNLSRTLMLVKKQGVN